MKVDALKRDVVASLPRKLTSFTTSNKVQPDVSCNMPSQRSPPKRVWHRGLLDWPVVTQTGTIPGFANKNFEVGEGCEGIVAVHVLSMPLLQDGAENKVFREPTPDRVTVPGAGAWFDRFPKSSTTWARHRKSRAPASVAERSIYP